MDDPGPNDPIDRNMSTVAISTDGNTIAYVSASDADAVPQVCVSTNGGSAFVQTELTGGNVPPSGIVFPNPAGVPASIEFNYAFFAPDGLHGWIIGLDDTNDLGLALVTTDGGQTWSVDATGIANVDPANEERLRAGFALDATHVWIGGDHGVLFAYTPQ